MSKTETKSRVGTDVSDGIGAMGDVTSAMAGFVGDIKGLRDDINEKMQQQEERLTMLDKKSVSMGRPTLSAAADAEAPHQKAFEAYVRGGDDEGLRGLAMEGKAMSTTVAADGGYLVDPETSETIKSVLKSTASLRQVATVVNVESTSFDVLIDHTDIGSGWSTYSSTKASTSRGHSSSPGG